jgi:hypothetical protein
LILTAALLTSKFYNDVFYGNHFVAYIGGVHLEEMNLLEVEFLRFLDWRLWVEPADYDFYGQGVLQHFAFLEQQQQAALMQQQALLM